MPLDQIPSLCHALVAEIRVPVSEIIATLELDRWMSLSCKSARVADPWHMIVMMHRQRLSDGPEIPQSSSGVAYPRRAQLCGLEGDECAPREREGKAVSANLFGYEHRVPCAQPLALIGYIFLKYLVGAPLVFDEKMTETVL